METGDLTEEGDYQQGACHQQEAEIRYQQDLTMNANVGYIAVVLTQWGVGGGSIYSDKEVVALIERWWERFQGYTGLRVATHYVRFVVVHS